MTATATPATVAPRMGMIGGVLRGAGARLHTDEDLPSEFQREVMNARAGEAAAQILANSALLDLAITEQLLLDMTIQRDAIQAELAATGPVMDVAARDHHRGTASGDLSGAYINYIEGGAR